MSLHFRYRMDFIAGRNASFTGKVIEESFGYTDPSTYVEAVAHDIKFGASASVSINFGGLTVAKAILITGPLKMKVLLDGGANEWVLDTGENSEALMFFKGSATALKLINRQATSGIVSVRLLGR